MLIFNTPEKMFHVNYLLPIDTYGKNMSYKINSNIVFLGFIRQTD